MIYVDYSLHQRIKELADKKGMKIYKLVEQSLKKKLEREKKGK